VCLWRRSRSHRGTGTISLACSRSRSLRAEYRFGTNLPAASTSDLQLSPDGSYILAATHGPGLWKIATP
jgi:hypothetical protein